MMPLNQLQIKKCSFVRLLKEGSLGFSYFNLTCLVATQLSLCNQHQCLFKKLLWKVLPKEYLIIIIWVSVQSYLNGGYFSIFILCSEFESGCAHIAHLVGYTVSIHLLAWLLILSYCLW